LPQSQALILGFSEAACRDDDTFQNRTLPPPESNRSGEFALDLQHPYRLIFKQDGIAAVRILEIVDYH
jgi:plasmid maintenance system killer protein